MLHIYHWVIRAPYTSTKEARQGNTTRPLQSSTSFQKPATVYEKSNCRNPSSDCHRSKINPRTSLHAYSPTAWMVKLKLGFGPRNWGKWNGNSWAHPRMEMEMRFSTITWRYRCWILLCIIFLPFFLSSLVLFLHYKRRAWVSEWES